MSELGKINWKDAVVGLGFAICGGLVLALYNSVSAGGTIDFRTIIMSGISTGLLYLIKTYFSDDQGRIGGAF